jgi:hypothetical protein
MMFLIDVAIGNALVAGVLAVVVFSLALVWRPPALLHCLWLLVLVRFVMPPVISIPIRLPQGEVPADVSLELSFDGSSITQPVAHREANEVSDAQQREVSSTEPLVSPISDESNSEQDRTAVGTPLHPAEVRSPSQSSSVPTFQVSLFGFLIGVWIVGAGVVLLRSCGGSVGSGDC